MIWVIVLLAMALAFALGWIFYHHPASPSMPSKAEQAIAKSFDDQKTKIAGESDANLLRDLDNDLGNKR